MQASARRLRQHTGGRVRGVKTTSRKTGFRPSKQVCAALRSPLDARNPRAARMAEMSAKLGGPGSIDIFKRGVGFEGSPLTLSSPTAASTGNCVSPLRSPVISLTLTGTVK